MATHRFQFQRIRTADTPYYAAKRSCGWVLRGAFLREERPTAERAWLLHMAAARGAQAAHEGRR